MGENNYGEERVNFDEEHAEDMVQKGLWRLGWRESDLEAKPKGDPEKLKLAVRLRAETTVTIQWIAQRCEWELGHTSILCYTGNGVGNE